MPTDEFDSDLEKYQQKIASHASGAPSNQFLTFILSGEVFAISVLSIKEIIPYGIITQVPSINNSIEGVTNVRGNVIPVVSLSDRFKIKKCDPTPKTCIIIAATVFDNQKSHIGLVVDKVERVQDILPEQMEDVPTFGTKINKDFILKIGKVDDRFILILNSETILDLEELSKVYVKRQYRRRSSDN